MTLNRALTRLLNQGLRAPTCPLCHVAHKLDREYMWHFFDGYADSGEAIDALRAARGFCAAHADQLRILEVDGTGSTLGLSTVYVETLEGVLADLDAAAARGALARTAACPACAYRDAELERQAGYLHALLDESEDARAAFTDGPGVCLAHLPLAFTAAASDEQRARLLEAGLLIGGLVCLIIGALGAVGLAQAVLVGLGLLDYTNNKERR